MTVVAFRKDFMLHLYDTRCTGFIAMIAHPCFHCYVGHMQSAFRMEAGSSPVSFPSLHLAT